MTDGINCVTLYGRIAKPEFVEFGDEDAPTGTIFKCRLVTTRRYKDAKGEAQKVDTWHTVSVVNPYVVAWLVNQEPMPGDIATVMGHIEYRDYAKADGTRVHEATVTVSANGRCEIARSEKNIRERDREKAQKSVPAA